MSIPLKPDQPKDTLELLPPPRPRSTLAKLAIIFAATMGITFGLCTVSVITIDTSNVPGWFGQYIFPTSMIIEATCLLGLLAIALLTAARAIKNHFSGE
jgi:hypothetical protein